MRLLASTIVIGLLLAGCATDPPSGDATQTTPGASPPTTATTPGSVTPPAITPATATPTTTPVTPTTPGGGIWEGFVEVTLVADPMTARAGEEIRMTLAAKDHRETSVWTNPAFACDGSWDVRIWDASGTVLRVDDRDAMGCPTTDTYTTEVRPGENATAVYTWDGMIRPALGQSEPAPPGRYTITGSVRYATEAGTSNGSRDTAGAANATTTVEIIR